MNEHHDPALAALTTEQRRTVWEIAALLDAAQDPRPVPVAEACGEADEQNDDELDATQEADR